MNGVRLALSQVLLPVANVTAEPDLAGRLLWGRVESEASFRRIKNA